uniref:NADH-ubiquinone oxidoreductase chain 2 n=1 Tax=Moricella rufonota TaxID=1384683 RepID=A0A897G5E5_9HYME|nr:NADH dehydrogenase subunit 2 [Moricella rufonota]
MKKIFFNKKKFINKINNFKLLFIMTLMLGTLISINSNNWFNAWMGMEINLLSFIPLMLNQKKSSNSMMMYFIVQAMASSMIIFLMMTLKIELNLNKLNFMISIIQLSLLIKLGAAPFHWWTPKIILNLNWKMSLTFLTWQKITPIILLNSSSTNNFMIYLSSIISIIMGAILGMNQTLIKLIMIYSSINHTGWMLMTIMLSTSLMNFYFIIYSIMNLMICLMMNNYNINNINENFKNNNQSLIMKMMFMSMFLSLGGMPPMLGFLPKMLVLLLMMSNNMYIESFIFILMASITLSFYINPMLSMFLLTKFNNKWNNKNMQMNKSWIMFTIINLIMSLMTLPLIIKIFLY